jgi:hypothetical protein
MMQHKRFVLVMALTVIGSVLLVGIIDGLFLNR